MEHRSALIGATALYVAWTAATYLLEGRLETLLRPDATTLRLTYALIANVLVGIGLSLWFVRRLIQGGVASAREFGFHRIGRTAAAVFIGLMLGFAGYALQDPPTFRPVILLNGFSQVLVVSIAEVLVCWVVVGQTVRATLRSRGRIVAATAFLLVASVLFGVYHYAHSPPFNTLEMVLLLSGVGLLTGIFFLASRDLYGAIVFHNFMGMLGVLRALDQADRLETFAQPQWPLIATATLALGTLILLHWLWVRAHSPPSGP